MAQIQLALTRGADPFKLAECPHHPTRRFWLCPRGSDDPRRSADLRCFAIRIKGLLAFDGAKPTRSTTSSASPATNAWKKRSPLHCRKPASLAGHAANRHVSSATSCGRQETAGPGDGGSSARPNGRSKGQTHASLSPRSSRTITVVSACTKSSTAPAATPLRSADRSPSGIGLDRLLPIEGKPYQGMPTRPLRRPNQCRLHASQPAAPVVLVLRLHPDLRLAPHRLATYHICQRNLRHDPLKAPQNRRPSPNLRAPHQNRHGFRQPLPKRIPPRPLPINPRRRLRPNQAPNPNTNNKGYSAEKSNTANAATNPLDPNSKALHQASSKPKNTSRRTL